MTGTKCATEHQYTGEEVEHNTPDIMSDDNTITNIPEIAVPKTENN